MMSRSSMFTASSALTARGVMVIRDALSRTNSWPSAGLPATSLVARAPLAPGLLTTGIGWPRVLAAPSARARAIRSVLPPAAWPTERLTGPDGYLAESAAPPPATLPHAVSASSVTADAAPRIVRRVGKCFIGTPSWHGGRWGPEHL